MSNKFFIFFSKTARFGEKCAAETRYNGRSERARRYAERAQYDHSAFPVRCIVLYPAGPLRERRRRAERRRGEKNMANKKAEALIKCPFYLRENETTIVCEGVQKGTVMLTKFGCASLKRAHYRQSCFHEDGGVCFLAKSLFQKYEKEDA